VTAALMLPCGRITVVDDEDAHLLTTHTWRSRVSATGLTYVTAVAYRGDGRNTRVYLHRLVVGSTDRQEHTDHEDGDGLNNRRANLRRCSATQNMRNRRKRTIGISPYKGVELTRPNGRWQARIKVGPQRLGLGCYDTPEEAAAAYNAAALKYFDEFARLNILPSGGV